MEKILNISDDANQRHAIIFEESEIILELRFLSVVQIWIMNIEYKTFTLNGLKVVTGTTHMRSANMPFDFLCSDNSGHGLDPFRLGDFADDRNTLYILNSSDMETIRGISVQV